MQIKPAADKTALDTVVLENRAGRYGKTYIGSMDMEDQGSREEC